MDAIEDDQVPTLQFEHEVAPETAEYVPALQLRHAKLDDEPIEVEYVPKEHCVQADTPTVDDQEPALHVEH